MAILLRHGEVIRLPQTTLKGVPFKGNGWSAEIRTQGLLIPNQTRYQAALHPSNALYFASLYTVFRKPHIIDSLTPLG